MTSDGLPRDGGAGELIDAVVALCLAGVGVEQQRRAIAAELDAGREPMARQVIEVLYNRISERPPPEEVARMRDRLRSMGIGVHVPGGAGDPGRPGHAGHAVSPGHAGQSHLPDRYPPRLLDAWPDLGAPLWLFRSGRFRNGVEGGPGAPSPASVAPDRLAVLPAVAVVGTRHPTEDGITVAERLGSRLARAGAAVISGMARGIDQAAHAAALQSGGCSAAVLGTGHGVDYPRGSGRLRGALSRSGGLFSELLPGVPPRPHHFLARNRIIAGLADITVVVEGRARSGALHTARMAAAQGREVWAVPGSLNAPASQAPLALIADGANVVTDVDDVIRALGLTPPDDAAHGRHALHWPDAPAPEPEARADLTALQYSILALLSRVAVSVDQLVHRSGHPAPDVMAAVGHLQRLGLAAGDGTGVVAAGIPGISSGRD